MKIILGNDHGGYNLRSAVLRVLKEENIEVEDIGTDSQESVDYPEYGYRVARSVADGTCDRGILMCGSGVGMSIVANKVTGVRAALVMTPEQAELSKKHNDANILVLAGRLINEQTAEECVRRWLNASFEGGRHERRIKLIHEMAEGEDR